MIISIYRKINRYLNDESLEKLFVRVLVVGDTKEILSSRVFHGGDNIILCLKVLNPTCIQLRRVVAKERNGVSLKPERKKMKQRRSLHALADVDLLELTVIILTELTLGSLEKLKSLYVEFLLSGD